MFKRILVLFLSFVLLAACGSTKTIDNPTTTSDQNQNQGNSTTDNVIEKEQEVSNLQVNLNAEQEQSEVNLQVIIENNNSEDIELTFASGQKYEITVVRNDQEVYKYSEGKSFTQAKQSIIIQSQSSVEWTEVWELDNDLTTGEYKAEVEVLASNVTTEKLLANHKFIINTPENTAFRNVKVSGADGNYNVTGEARVFEGVFQYRVEDGHDYLIEEQPITVKSGAPEWSEFNINIEIPEGKLPHNGTITLELFERSAKDGSVDNSYFVKLDQIMKQVD